MLKNNSPLITVLMTAYNAERFIGRAIESILKQTYQNFEFIIVDDGSSDSTLKIIKSYAAKDNRIRPFCLKENKGPSIASNLGIKYAKGIYIARMDADDISFSDRLEKQVKYIQSHPDTVLLGGQCVLINEEDEVIGKKLFPTSHNEIYMSLFRMNPIPHPGCMINTKLLPRNFIYYETDSVLAHDLELIFVLARYGRLANLADAVVYYRHNPRSLSVKNPKFTFKATLEVRKRAVQKYFYKPSIKSLVSNYMQVFVVYILPNRAIYPVFALVRLKSQSNYKQSLGRLFSLSKVKFGRRLLVAKTTFASLLVKAE